MDIFPRFYSFLDVLFLGIYAVMNIAMIRRTRKGARWVRVVSAGYGFALAGLFSWVTFITKDYYFANNIGQEIIRPAVATFFGYLAALVVFSYLSRDKKP